MRNYLLLLTCILSAITLPRARGDTYIAWRPVAGTTQPSMEDRQRATTLARESIALLDQHDLIGAETKLRAALELLPNKAVWHFNLACILTARGQVDGAMDSLQRATDCGFTDFTLLESDPDFKPLHDLPRFQQLIARKAEICHNAAQMALHELQGQFGKGYLYEVDEDQKLIFATNTDQETLDALKTSLVAQAKSQEAELFSHKPDEFIRVVVPSLADYRKLMRVPGVKGIYEDTSRTLMAQSLGQVMTHEFTHALHAADQRAVGQEHPIWLREGLASMYEAGEFVDGKLIPHDNYRLANIQSAARRDAIVPFDKLFALPIADFMRGPEISYGESSSLLLYLYEQKQLRKFYDTYKANYATDQTGTLAMEQTTGMKLPELQKIWTAWMLERKSPSRGTGLSGPYLGVHFGIAIDGLNIMMVLPASPAAKAGLKQNDVIVGFNSHEVRDYASFTPMLAEHKPGDRVTFKVRRDGQYLDVAVELGQR